MDAADQGGEALPQVPALGDLVGGAGDEDAPLSMMATCVHSCWTVAITCEDRMTVPPRRV